MSIFSYYSLCSKQVFSFLIVLTSVMLLPMASAGADGIEHIPNDTILEAAWRRSASNSFGIINVAKFCGKAVVAYKLSKEVIERIATTTHEMAHALAHKYFTGAPINIILGATSLPEASSTIWHIGGGIKIVNFFKKACGVAFLDGDFLADKPLTRTIGPVVGACTAHLFTIMALYLSCKDNNANSVPYLLGICTAASMSAEDNLYNLVPLVQVNQGVQGERQEKNLAIALRTFLNPNSKSKKSAFDNFDNKDIECSDGFLFVLRLVSGHLSNNYEKAIKKTHEIANWSRGINVILSIPTVYKLLRATLGRT